MDAWAIKTRSGLKALDGRERGYEGFTSRDRLTEHFRWIGLGVTRGDKVCATSDGGTVRARIGDGASRGFGAKRHRPRFGVGAAGRGGRSGPGRIYDVCAPLSGQRLDQHGKLSDASAWRICQCRSAFTRWRHASIDALPLSILSIFDRSLVKVLGDVVCSRHWIRCEQHAIANLPTIWVDSWAHPYRMPRPKRRQTKVLEDDEEVQDQDMDLEEPEQEDYEEPIAKRPRRRTRTGRAAIVEDDDEDEDVEERDEEAEDVEAEDAEGEQEDVVEGEEMDEPLDLPHQLLQGTLVPNQCVVLTQTTRRNSNRHDGRYEHHAPGAIVRIRLHKFLTYDHGECFPSPRLNMVMGPNGSGKSSLVCAIAIALGASLNVGAAPLSAYLAQVLGRSQKLSEFVKHAAESGFVEIELKGDGGPNVVIRRNIKKTNSTCTWKLNGQKATEKKVREQIAKLNVQVDNLWY